jgi:hypothetical protein
MDHRLSLALFIGVKSVLVGWLINNHLRIIYMRRLGQLHQFKSKRYFEVRNINDSGYYQ